MNKHENVKGDQTEQLAKFSQHQILVMIPEWKLEEKSIKVLELLDNFHFFTICRNYIRYPVLLFFYI